VQNFNEASSHYFECLKNYESFANVVRDFEKKPSCKGLKIEHFLLKPVQRLPQYKLLLETYLKNLSPDAEDYQNALEALDIVTKAAAHANEQMKQTDNFKKLLTLQTRLGVADLVQANRELIKEGEIQKISRAGIDVRYLILCSDYLIYAKAAGALTNATGVDGALRVTYRIPLASLEVVEPPTAAEYALDFSIISPVRSCTFRASTSAERTAWVAALKRTAAEARRRRATFATAAGGGERRGGGALGAAAPVWVPDERVTMCQRCHHDFSLLVRRHHCRACGKVICALCSANRAPLEYRNHEPSRVCDLCYDELIKDESLSAYRGRFKRENMPVGVRGGQGHGSRVVPARLKAVAAGDATAQMSGYLHRSKGGGAYKRCWFVLKDHVLYSYRAPEDTAAVDTLPVLGFDLELITTVSLTTIIGSSIHIIVLKIMHNKLCNIFLGSQ
jgi:FYVE/RhoGEF/PH domain-containing protein 5/6